MQKIKKVELFGKIKYNTTSKLKEQFKWHGHRNDFLAHFALADFIAMACFCVNMSV
ncbi:hypothetical protein CE91St36_10660 [Christensenellaceae bacterium]|nr:hypothetical protein CE91St36_10660 [Christensenellaceae bacterium]BDF60917.1 hypothetical protein CE91St37_10670 [Christensenellaceae bacterium]